jgi:hypothetical protein
MYIFIYYKENVPPLQKQLIDCTADICQKQFLCLKRKISVSKIFLKYINLHIPKIYWSDGTNFTPWERVNTGFPSSLSQWFPTF